MSKIAEISLMRVVTTKAKKNFFLDKNAWNKSTPPIGAMLLTTPAYV